MSLLDFLEKVGMGTSDILLLVVVLASLVEISPIKVNPWKTIINLIGKGLNADLSKKFDDISVQVSNLEADIKNVHDEAVTLNAKIDKVEHDNMENAAITARVRILRFCDEMYSHVDHTKDSYDQVMSDITFYEEYCRNHPEFKNNQTALTVDFIKESYHDRLVNGDFKVFIPKSKS